MEEEWRDINIHNGIFQVSNLGRVKKLEHTILKSDGRTQKCKEHMLKITNNIRSGRPCVDLRYMNKRFNVKVYRLVAEAFVYNNDPINKTCVNHIDGNVENCNANNLEWCSYSENLKHSYDYLNRPINKAKQYKRNVISTNKITNKTVEYESIEETSRNTGVSCTQIRRIATRECVNKVYIFEIPSLINEKEIL